MQKSYKITIYICQIFKNLLIVRNSNMPLKPCSHLKCAFAFGNN